MNNTSTDDLILYEADKRRAERLVRMNRAFDDIDYQLAKLDALIKTAESLRLVEKKA